MPRFYFDLHAGSLSEWDDEGCDAAGAVEAVEVAKEMLPGVLASSDRLLGDRHAVVMIRDRDGGETATVTLKADGEVRVVWPPGRRFR